MAILSVNGILTPAAATAPTSVQLVVGPPGADGPAGPAGAAGAAGTPQVTLDFWENDGFDDSGTKQLAYERLVNFTPLAGTLTAELVAYVSSAGGTALFKLRLGGTKGLPDGTVLASFSTASGSPVALNGASSPFANPGGPAARQGDPAEQRQHRGLYHLRPHGDNSMSTSPYTFADLSTAETQAMIRARLLAALAASGQPTTSWAPSSVGGLENTRLDMVSGGLAQWMAARYAAAVRGRLLLAAQDDPTLGFFLSYLGKKNYQLTRIQPTFTIKNFALIANDRASTTTYQPGQLVARSPATGNRYILNAVANVVAGAVVRGVPFIAENPGAAYADAEGTVTQLVTGKAGLSVQDSPEFQNGFRPTAATGASTGTVTGAVDPANAPYSLVVVRIESTGNVGVAGYSVSTDGGLTFVPSGVTSSLPTALPGGVGTLTFANGIVGPSFAAGSVFYLTVDSAFVQRGRDIESPAAFQQACSNRWPALSLVPVKGTMASSGRARPPRRLRRCSPRPTRMCRAGS